MIKCKAVSAVKYNLNAEVESYSFDSEKLKALTTNVVTKYGAGDWEKAILEMSKRNIIRYVTQEVYFPEELAPGEREYAYHIFTKIPVADVEDKIITSYYMCWLELEFNTSDEESEATNFFHKLCDMQDNGTL